MTIAFYSHFLPHREHGYLLNKDQPVSDHGVHFCDFHGSRNSDISL